MKFSTDHHHRDSRNNDHNSSSSNGHQFKRNKHKFNHTNDSNKTQGSPPKLAKMAEVYDNKLKIFIKNIPNDGEAVKTQIQQLLSDCGEVILERYFTRRRGTHLVHSALIVLKTEAAVSKALEIHGSLVEGHHIIVSTYAQYNTNSNGVHIKNLPWDASEEDLWNLFENIGKILFINIVNPINLNESDQLLEGEVIFETEEEAKEALFLDNSELHGHPLDISRISRDDKGLADLAVHISGLPQDVTKEKVIQVFEKCGVVRIVKVNFKLLSAVVHFTSEEAVKAALKLNGSSLNDCKISVQQRKGEVLNLNLENPVYIYNIHESVKDVDIFIAFQDCGYITEVRFLRRRTISKKRAVIEFKYPDSVVKALELDGLMLGGEPASVSNSEDCLSRENTLQSEMNGCGSSKLKLKNKNKNQSTKQKGLTAKKAKNHRDTNH